MTRTSRVNSQLPAPNVQGDCARVTFLEVGGWRLGVIALMLSAAIGCTKQAAEEFETALRLNPSNARAYTNLGLITYRMGDKEKARSLWEKALSVDPQFSDAQRALSLLQRGALAKD